MKDFMQDFIRGFQYFRVAMTAHKAMLSGYPIYFWGAIAPSRTMAPWDHEWVFCNGQWVAHPW